MSLVSCASFPAGERCHLGQTSDCWGVKADAPRCQQHRLITVSSNRKGTKFVLKKVKHQVSFQSPCYQTLDDNKTFDDPIHVISNLGSNWKQNSYKVLIQIFKKIITMVVTKKAGIGFGDN